jgi:hypothetical protein
VRRILAGGAAQRLDPLQCIRSEVYSWRQTGMAVPFSIAATRPTCNICKLRKRCEGFSPLHLCLEAVHTAQAGFDQGAGYNRVLRELRFLSTPTTMLRQEENNTEEILCPITRKKRC